jgi:hypothetical protein
MVLVRTATLAGLTQAGVASRYTVAPRHSIIAFGGMQLVRQGRVSWTDKAMWLRNAPYTALFPWPGQAEWRKKFGETARTTKGRTGKATYTIKGRTNPRKGQTVTLPTPAALIGEALAGQQATKRFPSPKEYPSRKRRTYHTMEELDAFITGAAAGPS